MNIKNLLRFITLAVMIFVINSCNSEPVVAPQDYHDNLIIAYTELDKQIADFSFGIWDTTYTVANLVDSYDENQAIIEKNLTKLKEISELVDDPGLLISVIDFYENVKKILNNEYAEILSFYEKDIWDESFNQKISKLDNQAIEVILDKENEVIKQQELFAIAYGFTLE